MMPAEEEFPPTSLQRTMQEMTDRIQAVIATAERAAEAIRFDAEEQARLHLADAQRKADLLTSERVGLISELTDDLMRHASTVHEHSEQMIRALEGAITSITEKLDQPGVAESSGAFFEALPVVDPDSTRPAELVGPDPASVPSAHMPPPPPSSSPPPPGPAVAEPGRLVGAPSGDDSSGPSPHSPEDPGAVKAQDQEVPLDAVVYAAQLAMNGTDPTVIASELSKRYGIEDPDPVVRQVVGP